MRRVAGFELPPMSRSMSKRQSRSQHLAATLARTVLLAGQAARCRRLADGLPDETVRQKLLALAAEYEAKVLAIKNCGVLTTITS
jgi:hypothetical protein